MRRRRPSVRPPSTCSAFSFPSVYLKLFQGSRHMFDPIPLLLELVRASRFASGVVSTVCLEAGATRRRFPLLARAARFVAPSECVQRRGEGARDLGVGPPTASCSCRRSGSTRRLPTQLEISLRVSSSVRVSPRVFQPRSPFSRALPSSVLKTRYSLILPPWRKVCVRVPGARKMPSLVFA